MKDGKQLKLFKNIRDLISELFAALIGSIVNTYKKIAKWDRKRKFEKRREYINLAVGEIVERLELFLFSIFDEAVRDYESTMEQTKETKQAVEDIRRFLEIKIKSYITRKDI